MELGSQARSIVRTARKRGALWVRLLDFARLAASREGRAILWTRTFHRREVHQTTPYTCEERYPALFDFAAELAPDAGRILSFGCSTGEELSALRRRFPGAEIVGAEINPRSRRIAARRVAGNPHTTVTHPRGLQGSFDLVFALAVLQREPHKVDAMGVEDLSGHYPFARFDAAVRQLARLLGRNGILCVSNMQYRIEDSTVAAELEPVAAAPIVSGSFYSPNGRLVERATACTMFRKRG